HSHLIDSAMHVIPTSVIRHFGALAAAVATVSSCAPTPPAVAPSPVAITRPDSILIPAPPGGAGLAATLPTTLDSIINAAIADRTAPAVAVAVGRYGRLVYAHSYGRLTYSDTMPKVDEHTRFDMASLTKVVATTTAAMMLEEQGKRDIDRTVASYLPEFNAQDKQGITVRMLLTHRGGLEAFAALWQRFHGRAEYLQQINARPLAYTPGTKMVYSDWDYVLMQAIVERISGESLDTFTETRIFAPLGMMETGFLPDTVNRRHIAPTEVDSIRGLVWGKVHDENANAIGGVSGHAGLFSTAHDVAIFTQMLLNGGTYGTVRLLRPETIARWTAIRDPGSSRTLGWDTPSGQSSAGRYFSPRSYGHTGFTGTSIWTDPERGVWVVLLTNRVYPTRANTKVGPLRRAVADAVQQAILDAPLVDWEARR
ncbi:MAG TPA: serine hydrolase, partial [Candidatus Elarobacter sp.]|nr:serine hydrolase [Candidatus Elarobacter sp.]